MKADRAISAFLTVIFFSGCGDSIPQTKETAQAKPERKAKPPLSPEELARIRSFQVTSRLRDAAGAAIIAEIQSKYSGIRGIEVALFGEATPNPSMGLYIPEPELLKLKQQQIAELKEHLRVHITKVRSNPSRYMNIPSTAPFYPRALQNVSKIRSEAWFIGAGRIENGKMNFDRAVYEGADHR